MRNTLSHVTGAAPGGMTDEELQIRLNAYPGMSWLNTPEHAEMTRRQWRNRGYTDTAQAAPARERGLRVDSMGTRAIQAVCGNCGSSMLLPHKPHLREAVRCECGSRATFVQHGGP